MSLMDGPMKDPMDGEVTRIPCGCVMETKIIDGEPTMIYESCSLTCKFYQYMLAESAKKGNQISKVYREDR